MVALNSLRYRPAITVGLYIVLLEPQCNPGYAQRRHIYNLTGFAVLTSPWFSVWGRGWGGVLRAKKCPGLQKLPLKGIQERAGALRGKGTPVETIQHKGI